MKFKKKRKGIALISVLLILTAMMVMTMGFASYTMQDYFVSKTFQQSNTCFYLASAGMDYFVYLIKHNLLVYPFYPYSNAKIVNEKPSGPSELNTIYILSGGDSPGTPVTWNITTEQEFGRNISIPEDPNAGENDGSGNNYDDGGTTNVIDATEVEKGNQSQLTATYDANLFDGTATAHAPGKIINVYNSPGQEMLVINRLAILSDSVISTSLDTGNACGTFRILANEMPDPNASGDTSKRVIFLTSTGIIRKVPNDVWNNDPSTWNLSTFQILAQRTLIVRLPYSRVGTSVNYQTQVMFDGWFERFR